MPGRGGPTSARRGIRVQAGLVASVLVLGTLLVFAGPAVPAGAATPTARNPRPGLCVRVRNQWARLVVANKRAKTAFQKASALRDRLLRPGRANLAHRLDVRLRYLRQIHVLLVDRVQLVAARASGVCSDRPPVLDSY
jgi:hypothetical protein